MAQRWRALVVTIRGALAGGILREFVGFGSSTVLMQASRVVSDLVVAAMLGPETWGAWYLLNLIIVYGALGQLGALNGMNREVPAALGRDRPDEASDLRRVTLGVMLATTAAVSASLLVASLFLPSPAAPRELLVVLVLLAAHQGHNYAVTSLKATTRFMAVARLQLVMVVAYPLFGVGGALLGGLAGFIAGQVLAYALVSAFASRSREVILRPRFDLVRARALIKIGFPIMLVGVVHVFYTTVDRWIVVAFLGTESLGHYSLAIMTLSAVGLLPRVIGQQFYPRMAFAWSANRDPDELRAIAARVRTMAFAVVIPAVLAVMIAVPPLVRALLPAYEPGIAPLLVTMIVPLVSVVGQGFGGVLHMLDRQNWLLGAITVALIVNGIVGALLVGPLGLVGVAVGTLVAHALYAALRVWLGHKALRSLTSPQGPLRKASIDRVES